MSQVNHVIPNVMNWNDVHSFGFFNLSQNVKNEMKELYIIHRQIWFPWGKYKSFYLVLQTTSLSPKALYLNGTIV